MQLHGIGRQSVELHIVGYQFPDLAAVEYDSNWLRIEGYVSHPRGRWSFQDPCLLTYEVSRLANWLDALAQQDPNGDEIGFVEPNLSFRIVRSEASAMLRVYFELEARPNWVAAPSAGLSDLWVEFRVQELELRQAARSLRQELAIYPQRTSR
jgi:hypothetical protein